LLIEWELVGQFDAELVQELLLLWGRLGDAPEANFTPVSGGQYNVSAL